VYFTFKNITNFDFLIKNAKIMKMKLKQFICFTILSLLFNTNLNSQTLHALIFYGNNDIKATLREGISNASEDMRAELRRVSSALEINYNEIQAGGEHFSAEVLQFSLSQLNPGSDDIIFFYYIGHGINKPEIDAKWPQLAFLTSHTNKSTTLISFTEIVNQLKNKKPRLLIAFAEACNAKSGRTEYFQEEILGLASLNFGDRNKEMLSELYLRSEGTIISSSSEPGQVSYVSRAGGYFSSSFIEVQKELTTISNVADWYTLLEKTKLRTASLAGAKKDEHRKQVPQYTVNIRGIKRPEFAWQNQINNKSNVYQEQPRNFNYQMGYQNQSHFLVAKVVFFGNTSRVFFVMPDNYITEYNPFFGLQVVGFRSIPLQPQYFQWDIISYYNPYQFNRWGVDYYGRIMEWHPHFGWQYVGIVYY
jgi:hypothetical protein